MSTPHDPAVEAARRVWARDHIGPVLAPSEAMEDAAREALKPIRELHKPARICPSLDHTNFDMTCPACESVCDQCSTEWPCDTAHRCYSTEELEARRDQ